MPLKGFGHQKHYERKKGGGASDNLGQRTRTFYLNWDPNKKNKTTVAMLDDQPFGAYRHRLYLQGRENWRSNQLRLTCAASESGDASPRTCKVCNAALKNTDIARKVFFYLSVMDEDGFVSRTGEQYTHWKYLLELDQTEYERWGERAETYGTLTGVRFKAFRPSSKTSKAIGDWSPLDGGKPVDLRGHVWDAPAVGRLIAASAKQPRGVLSHEDAVRTIISPVDYEAEIMNYTPEHADIFLAAAGVDISTSDAGSATDSPQSSVPPVLRPSEVPVSYAPPAMPDPVGATPPPTPVPVPAETAQRHDTGWRPATTPAPKRRKPRPRRKDPL